MSEIALQAVGLVRRLEGAISHTLVNGIDLSVNKGVKRDCPWTALTPSVPKQIPARWMTRQRDKIQAVADKVIVLRSARKPVDEANFRIKYAELLNASQLAAVTHRDGTILVVAGAGSGKTRTLIYRVARLIESGVPPGAILLLTFTRRAARRGPITPASRSRVTKSGGRSVGLTRPARRWRASCFPACSTGIPI